MAAIRAVVPAEQESVLAFDPSYVPKSGKHTAGLGHFWNGSAGRAEPGLEVNALSWVDVTANTAYTISAEMTPPGTGAASVTETPTTPEMVPAKAPSPSPEGQSQGQAQSQGQGQGRSKSER